MLQITLLSIGKTNENFIKLGLDKYNTLLSKYCKFDNIELNDVKNANKLPVEKLKLAEAELINQHLNEKAIVVYLDEKGKQYDSHAFAKYVEKMSVESSKITFVIGGSFGLDHTSLKKGDKMALSSMTFTHQMSRVIIAEQLFRAFTINHGTTYHH